MLLGTRRIPRLVLDDNLLGQRATNGSPKEIAALVRGGAGVGLGRNQWLPTWMGARSAHWREAASQ